MTFRWSSASPSYCPKNCGEKLRHLVQQHLDLHFSPVTLLFQHLIAQCFPVFPTGSTFENFPNVSLRDVFLVFAVVDFVGVEFSNDHFQATNIGGCASLVRLVIRSSRVFRTTGQHFLSLHNKHLGKETSFVIMSGGLRYLLHNR